MIAMTYYETQSRAELGNPLLGWLKSKATTLLLLSIVVLGLLNLWTFAELKSLSQENAQLAANRKDLAQKTDVLVAQTMSLAAQHVALAKSHDAMTAKVTTQRTAVRAFTQRTVRRAGVSAARTVATAPGKAAPIIGTGVIIAGAAMDLYDLCETMKDLNSLNGTFENTAEDITTICGVTVFGGRSGSPHK